MVSSPWIDLQLHRILLTQTAGYASSSNTLYTGAQGSEHSASYSDPGDCATNIDVYPIGTLIYVVVSAGPMIPFQPTRSLVLNEPPLHIYLFPTKSISAHTSNRGFKSISRSKTPAALALRNPSRTSTSGWECPATATKHNSRHALMASLSPTRLRQSSSTLTMDITSIRRR